MARHDTKSHRLAYHPGAMEQRFDCTIVGGGISGLAAAWRLASHGRRVALLEAAEHLGGAIHTVEDGGFRFEAGPNTVLAGPALDELIVEVRLGARRIEAASAARRRFVWKAGALVPLPGGPSALLRTTLFSPAAKLRLLREPFVARAPSETEETVAAFARRRLGPEILRYAIAPFISGVYAGDPEQLSARHATRKLHALEAEHGSLLRGAWKKRGGGRSRTALVSFVDGLCELPHAIARRLADRGAHVQTGVRAGAIVRTKDGFRVAGLDGLSRALVIATGAATAAELLRGCEPRAASLAEIDHAPVAVVNLGLRREHVAHSLDGFGFLVPRGEGLRMLGCLFASSLFPDRAPSGAVTLTCFFGGTTDRPAAALHVRELEQLALTELERTLGVRGAPVIVRLSRWPDAIPQYRIGHGRFLALAREIEAAQPGLYLAGNYLGGVSVGDCVAGARLVADRAHQAMGASRENER
jgi:oxygen-dependent protoporphyrinogen oxidase